MMRKLIISDDDWWRLKRRVEQAMFADAGAAERYEKGAKDWAGNPEQRKLLILEAAERRKSAEEARRLLQVLGQAEILPEELPCGN